MKRKDFFKSCGALAIAPLVISESIIKEPEIKGDKCLAIDIEQLPANFSPEEIIRIYRQTGVLMYGARELNMTVSEFESKKIKTK